MALPPARAIQGCAALRPRSAAQVIRTVAKPLLSLTQFLNRLLMMILGLR